MFDVEDFALLTAAVYRSNFHNFSGADHSMLDQICRRNWKLIDRLEMEEVKVCCLLNVKARLHFLFFLLQHIIDIGERSRLTQQISTFHFLCTCTTRSYSILQYLRSLDITYT